MSNTNTNAVDFHELYSNLKDEYGDDTMPKWKARRLVVSVQHDYPRAGKALLN